MIRIGVISDTHGLVRPQAIEALRGSELIVHAGDIGEPGVIDALMALAPVRAIRGNTDLDPWTRKMPDRILVEVGGIRILVVHDAQSIDFDPREQGVRVVICGHSHRAAQIERSGLLLFNPGSAGPRRFDLPVSVGRLIVQGGEVRGETLTLAVPTEA